MFKALLQYVLPKEIIDSFDLVNLQDEEETLHLYLDECNVVPEEYKDLLLSPNGFYEASLIKDFPLRDKKVVLHIRRRRWVDEEGKSYSRYWDLVAEGTRYSKEFAIFLKGAFGYLPDSSPIS
jgi:transposase